MPVVSQFSWLLHGNDEGTHSDGLHALSVNWVMPAGPDNDIAVDDQFWKEVDQLIWPWEWDVFGWHGIESAQSLAIKRISVGWQSDPPQNTLDIQPRIKEQIKTRTHGCTKPFTVQVPPPEAAPGSPLPACLPNEFAPLTHLPAGISANVLGMARALRLSKDERDKFSYLVPEFRAMIGGLDGHSARTWPACRGRTQPSLR